MSNNLQITDGKALVAEQSKSLFVSEFAGLVGLVGNAIEIGIIGNVFREDVPDSG